MSFAAEEVQKSHKLRVCKTLPSLMLLPSNETGTLIERNHRSIDTSYPMPPQQRLRSVNGARYAHGDAVRPANPAALILTRQRSPKQKPVVFQKTGYAPQFRGACFERMRCRVRRCIFRRRAVSETLRSQSSKMRWMCSQRTRSADIGSSGGSGAPSS